MTKHNEIAKKLDAAFREARDNYAKAAQKLGAAVTENRNANSWYRETYTGEREARQAEAALRLQTERESFRVESKRIWSSFDETERELRKELENEVKKNSLADPADVDMAALELLKSGVMTADDMVMFSSKYDRNPTMLKLIAKYSGEAAEKAKENGNTRAFAQYAAVEQNARNGESRVVRAWDDLVSVAKYCSGRGNNSDRTHSDPDFTVRMGENWEKLTSEKIAEF